MARRPDQAGAADASEIGDRAIDEARESSALGEAQKPGPGRSVRNAGGVGLAVADATGRGFARGGTATVAAGIGFASLLGMAASLGATADAGAAAIVGAGGDGGVAVIRSTAALSRDLLVNGPQANTRMPTRRITPSIATPAARRGVERDNLGAATDSVWTCGASLVAEMRSSGHRKAGSPVAKDAGVSGVADDSRAPKGSGTVPRFGEAIVSGAERFVVAPRSIASRVATAGAFVSGTASGGPRVGAVTPWSVVLGKLVWAEGRSSRADEMM